MERERLVEDSARDAPAPSDAPDHAPGSDFDIDVDRAVGHEIMLDETNWIQ